MNRPGQDIPWVPLNEPFPPLRINKKGISNATILFLLVALIFIRERRKILSRYEKIKLQEAAIITKNKNDILKKSEIWPWPKESNKIKIIRSKTKNIPIWIKTQTYSNNKKLFDPAWDVNNIRGKLVLTDWFANDDHTGWVPVWVDNIKMLENLNIEWHPAVFQLPDIIERPQEKKEILLPEKKEIQQNNIRPPSSPIHDVYIRKSINNRNDHLVWIYFDDYNKNIMTKAYDEKQISHYDWVNKFNYGKYELVWVKNTKILDDMQISWNNAEILETWPIKIKYINLDPKNVDRINGQVFWIRNSDYNEYINEFNLGFHNQPIEQAWMGKLTNGFKWDDEEDMHNDWVPVWVENESVIDNAGFPYHFANIQLGGMKLPDFTNKTLQQAAAILESYKFPSLPPNIKSIHIPVNESEIDQFINDINKAIIKYVPELKKL